MTRDELIAFLNGTKVPKPEQAWLDLEARRTQEDARAQNPEREWKASRKARRLQPTRSGGRSTE